MFSIVSVGRSGAGKSSIGNILLHGVPEHPDGFKCGAGVKAVTTDVETKSNGNFTVTDVPGIPDTNPRNTKGHYDKIVRALRTTPRSAVFFVFEYGRIDGDKRIEYKQAGLLTREFCKVSCPKILFINNKVTNFSGPPTNKELNDMVAEISELMGLKFDFTFVSPSPGDLVAMVNKIKNEYTDILPQRPKLPNTPLKTFDEVKADLDRLGDQASIEKELYDNKMQEISNQEDVITGLEITAASLAATATGATIASFFTFGLTLGIATPTAVAAGASIVALEVARSVLQKLKEEISPDKMNSLVSKYQEQQKDFKDLCRVLEVAE